MIFASNRFLIRQPLAYFTVILLLAVFFHEGLSAEQYDSCEGVHRVEESLSINGLDTAIISEGIVYRNCRTGYLQQLSSRSGRQRTTLVSFRAGLEDQQTSLDGFAPSGVITLSKKSIRYKDDGLAIRLYDMIFQSMQGKLDDVEQDFSIERQSSCSGINAEPCLQQTTLSPTSSLLAKLIREIRISESGSFVKIVVEQGNNQIRTVLVHRTQVNDVKIGADKTLVSACTQGLSKQSKQLPVVGALSDFILLCRYALDPTLSDSDIRNSALLSAEVFRNKRSLKPGL